MSHPTYYRQCRLTRQAACGVAETVTWLPEKFATVGQVVKLRDDEKRWVDGWRVLTVGETRKEERSPPDYRKMIRSHRNATGGADTR